VIQLVPSFDDGKKLFYLPLDQVMNFIENLEIELRMLPSGGPIWTVLDKIKEIVLQAAEKKYHIFYETSLANFETE
jgi:hypothetical protein